MTARIACYRRHRNSLFRALVALEACRVGASAAQVAARHGVAADEVVAWKRRLAHGTARWARRSGQAWWF